MDPTKLISAVRLLLEHVSGLGDIGTDGTDAQRLALAYLVRSEDVLEGVLVLAERQLFSEAGALGRVLCEIAVTSAWILQESGVDRTQQEQNERAKRVLDQFVLNQRRSWWSGESKILVRRRKQRPLRRRQLRYVGVAAGSGGSRRTWNRWRSKPGDRLHRCTPFRIGLCPSQLTPQSRLWLRPPTGTRTSTRGERWPL
jgi:hypothetical protein